MNVQPVYDPMDAGPIPEAWESVALGQLFSFKNGANADKEAYGRGTSFVNVLEVITHSHLQLRDIPGKVVVGAAARETYSVQFGDVLFNRTSETQEDVGLAAVYVDPAPAVFGGFVIRARPTGSCLDPVYSGYALRGPRIRSQIIARGQGAIRTNIGQSDLKQIAAPIPSLPEQRAIAAALGDVDSLLATLDAALAKKRALKQAVMRRLLAGQTRLPGFTGEWAVTSVRKAGTVLGGRQRSPNNSGGLTKYLRVANVFDGYIDTGDVLEMPFSPEEQSRFRLEDGDILLNEGQSIELVGRSAVYRGDPPDCCFQNTLIRFRAGPGTDVRFAHLTFQALLRAGVFASIALKTTSIAHLGAARFAALTIKLPPLDEQRAIADALCDMEAEIAALEARRDKTRLLKQAMMQELLTGRTRLV